ncbi:MAG: 23S rRNA (adenine(2030)-N(6))-methyltransferase RlmJ [Betaproteobacteria bacterium]|nr:23S rRNA (adenine(2030)-N(6))-methyltransferase RlmJ [Betaproteobacteria bacterium]
MLAYRHLFHAGNFADVFKHALLVRLLLALGRKDKPYCFLDTHAGTGRYDLAHPWAQKAREFENGIGRLWDRKDAPAALAPYLQAVHAENPDGKLRFYPGSPLIAKRFVRPGDRIILTELNKTDFAELKALFERDRRVAVHFLDAYQGLKAFLPPQERRGLVLIDSSFDRAREFERITKALRQAGERWATGTYAVWYPLMAPGAMLAFARSAKQSGIRRILRLELLVQERDFDITVPGCGMLVVNPPWRFADEARPLLDWLWRALSVAGAGSATIDWLVPE